MTSRAWESLRAFNAQEAIICSSAGPTPGSTDTNQALAKWVASAWFLGLWSHLGLNQGLPDYESGALTNWAIGPAYGGLSPFQSGCKDTNYLWTCNLLHHIFSHGCPFGQNHIIGLWGWLLSVLEWAFRSRVSLKRDILCTLSQINKKKDILFTFFKH